MPIEVDFGPELGRVSFPDEMTQDEIQAAAADARKQLIEFRQRELAAETPADLTAMESFGAAARAVPRVMGETFGKAIQATARTVGGAPTMAFREPGQFRTPDETRMLMEEQRRRDALTQAQREAEVEASPVMEAGRAVEQGAQQRFEAIPGEEEYVMPQLGAGVGSVGAMIPFGPAGPAVYGLSASEDVRREAGQVIDNRIAQAVSAGDMAAAAALEREKINIQNKAAFVGGTAWAVSENVLGVAGKITKGVPFVGPRLAGIAETVVPKFAGRLAERTVRGAVTGAPTEAAQETVEQGLLNASARMIYDPERSLGEGVFQSGGLGFGVGGIVGGVVGRRRPTPKLPAAEQAVAETGPGPAPTTQVAEEPELPEPELAPEEDVGELPEDDIQELIREATGGAEPGMPVIPVEEAMPVAPETAQGVTESVAPEGFTPIDRAVMDARAAEQPLAGLPDAEAGLAEAVEPGGETPVDVAVREAPTPLEATPLEATAVEATEQQAVPLEAQPQDEITQAVGELKEAWQAQQKLGITLRPEDTLRLYRALFNLARAYIRRGVNTVEDFAKQAGVALNAAVRRAFTDAQAGAESAVESLTADEAEALTSMPNPLDREDLGMRPAGTTTKRGAQMDVTAGRPGLTPKTEADADQFAADVFAEAGVAVVREPGSNRYAPATDFEQEIEGRRLLGIARRRIQEALAEGRPERVANLVNSLRENFGESAAFSPTLQAELGLLGQSVASQFGRGLGALAIDPMELGRASRDPYGTMARVLYQNFGGEEVQRFLQTVVQRFRGLFTDQEIKDITDQNANVRDLLNRLGLMSLKDDGSRVYRAVQQRLKTKPAKTPAEKERKAREDEAIDAIIEQAKRVGIEEPAPKPGQKLTPDERLALMVQPSTQAKIQQAVDTAVADAEFNAGWAVMEARAARSNDRTEADRVAEGRAAGERPPQDAIEAGLRLPEYAHWLGIRNSMLAYSPTTEKLVQDVIRGRFSGTRFQEAPKTKPEDNRINLTKLAAEPDAEVDRVMKAQLDSIDAVMDIGNATPEVRARIHAAVVRNIASQIQRARQVIRDRFLDPKTATKEAPPTASEKLRKLINAGITGDPRYKQQATRDLLAKVAATYVKARDFARMATAPRDAKQAFLAKVYQQVVTDENITDDWMRAAVWTRLTEQLMAAETAVAERMAGAKDVSYEPREAPSAEKQAARRAALEEKLAGGIRAGLLDQRMVRDLAAKPAVQRLLPNMTTLVRQVMDTSARGQKELAAKFSQAVGANLNIDPANADKAGALLAQAFGTKLEAARRKAVAAAAKQFEKRPEEEGGLGKPSWRRVIEAANAGLLDASEVLADLAKQEGYKMPTPEEAARIKELAQEVQDLETPTPEEEAAGITANEKAAMNSSRRSVLIKELRTRWARLTKPIQGNKQNRAEAINETSAANLLWRVAFATKQAYDVGHQMIMETGASAFESAIANYDASTDPNKRTQLVADIATAFGDAIESRLKAARMALSDMRRAVSGRAEREMTHSVQTGIMALERAELYAKELAAEGKYARAAVFRFLSLLRFSYRVASAMDYFQGTLAEQQMLRQHAEGELRTQGVPPSEARAKSKQIVGDMAAEYAMARAMVDNYAGIPANQKTEAAWELVRARQLVRMEAMGVDSAAFKSNAIMYRNLIGWNLPEKGGLGGMVGGTLNLFRAWMTKMGWPTPTANFANAMAIATNRALTHIGGGFFPSVFKGSPWFATQQLRTMRKFEAAVTLSMVAPLVAMWKAGMIRVFTRWPDDEEERQLREREGHRPYTVELDLGDGKALKLSMSVGLLAPLRPALVAMGEIDRAQAKLEKRNARAKATAERRGLRFVPEELTAEDKFQIAAMSAYGALLGGGRTTGGLISSAQFQGKFDPKRMLSSAVQPLVPFAPLARETTALMGRTIDPKASDFLAVAVPTPWSGEQKLNFLGDPVGTQSDLDRIISTLSGGTSVITGKEPERAYRLLAKTGWQPTGVSAQRQWSFGGTMRPMTPEEYKRFSVLWGRDLKRRLSVMPWGSDIEERMDEAEEAAKASAAKAVGVR